MNDSNIYSKALISFLFISLMVGAFFIRHRQFQGCGLFRDEPGTNTLSYRSVSEYIYPEHGAEPIEINGLFYYKFIQHPWQEFTGRILHDDTVYACRLSSLIGSILGLVFFFLLGQRYTDRYTALLATALLTINGCHQFYSNYLRYHIFSLLGAILLTYYLSVVLSKQNCKNWLFYHVLALINIYISLNNITLLPAHWLVICLTIGKTSHNDPKRQNLRNGLISSIILTGLAFCPMPLWDSQALERMSSYPNLSLNLYLNIYCCLVGLKEYLLTPVALLTLTSIAIFLLFGLVSVWQACKSQKNWQLLTIATWLIIPLGLHWLLSLTIQPLMITRNLIFVMPPFALLIALGIKKLVVSIWHKIIITAIWLVIVPTLLAQCGHNVFYEWDEPISSKYYNVPMYECCRCPGDHISGEPVSAQNLNIK